MATQLETVETSKIMITIDYNRLLIHEKQGEALCYKISK